MAYNQDDNLEKELLKYKAVYPQAPIDMKYHYYDGDVLKIRPETSTLIKSIDELREYVNSCKGVKIAVDTETTGLTYDKDFVVGFSIAKDMYHGIYVPIRHQIKRVEKVEVPLLDEAGNQLYTKAGKARVKKVTNETALENPLNLDPKEALDLLYEAMLNAQLVLMHNSEFDLTMIRQEGYDVMKCKTFDTTILTYLYDSENKGWNKLKEASKIVLGRHPMKFAEALGEEENFRFVDLEVAYPYGASDALNTFGLFEKLYPAVKALIAKAPKIMTFKGDDKPYNVVARDNELIRAFTDYYNRVDLLVNTDTAKEYQKYIEETLQSTETEIYEYFNKGLFNLATGSKEFKDTMKEFHIVTGAVTDKGAPSYGKEGITEMDRNLGKLKDILSNFKNIEYRENTGAFNKRQNKTALLLTELIKLYGKEQFKMTDSANLLTLRTVEGIKCTKHEIFDELKLMYKKVQQNMKILQLIQKRSSLMKALNSYIEKLTQVDKCHMRYRPQGTASGRLSSGNGSKSDKRKNHYFIDLNAQNLTKPHSAYYKAIPSDEPDNILGWKFELVTEEYYHQHKDDEIIVEGSDPKNNIRNCLVAPEGRYILSLDYSAQEYLVLAILSGDHKMINNFKNGIDPHTATAYMVWGEEHYDRQKRKKAKGCVGDGTLINTTRGQVPVNNLLPTDKLIGVDGKPQNYVMTDYVGDLIDIEWSNGLKSSFTPNHPVQVWDGTKIRWKAVSCLTKDDEVISYVGNYFEQPIKANMQCLKPLSFTKKVGHVNVIETENHTYIADGVGSHNCNFLMNYCGGAPTLAKNLNIPLEEAEEIIRKYEEGFFECIQWKQKSMRDCIERQNGVCFTLFGRPRQFKSRLTTAADLADMGMRAGAGYNPYTSKSTGMIKAVERRIISHHIQSTCGDICRWDLIRLYRKYFKHRNPDIDFMTTVHDEINFTATKEKAVDFAREIDDIMTITDFREDLPIKTSIDVGYTLGVLFPFEWEDETRQRLVPKRA